MNACILTGNLAADPEQHGQLVKFRLAVSERVKGETQTLWVDVLCFGKQGETAMNYLHKGSKVGVQGRIGLETFTGKDGVERSKLTLNCDKFDFLDSGKKAGGNGGYQQRTYNAPQQSANDAMGDMPDW